MSTHTLFADEFDDAAVVVRGRRWPGTARSGIAPFRLPALDQPVRVREPEAPRSFSEDELARAVEDARREAAAAAAAAVRAEMTASREQRQAEVQSAIAAQLAAAGAALEQALAARATASRELALALARALVARALERQPLADIEDMLQALVRRLEGQPWLEVELPPELAAAGEAALARIAADANFRGELRVVPEPALGPGAARVRWHEGIAERDLARIEAEAVALVGAWLPHPDHQMQAAPARPEPARDEGIER